MASSDIVIRGAREHNLRNISLSLPRNRLIVMTGVSGSGKSSLAFDTLYAEGQRRYVESLSTYARQFLGQLPKPEVDSIAGLAPSISIQQKSTSRNPRSTVGTITEVFDYLRVLYARVGQGYCHVSGLPIRAQSTDQIIDSLLSQPEGTRYAILAPIVQNQKGEFRDLFADLLKRGFLRARVDGVIINLSDAPVLRKHHKHSIEVVIDRLVAGGTQRTRVAEAVESALRLADGRLVCAVESARASKAAGTTTRSREDDRSPESEPPSTDRLYSTRYACPESGMSYEPPSPQLFSFNSPLGMCPDCHGLGQQFGFPMSRMVVDAGLSIQKGALLFLDWKALGRWPRHLLQGAAAAIEQDCRLPVDSLLKTPWRDLPEQARHLWLFGTGNRHVTFTWRSRGGVWKHGGLWEGWVNRLLQSYRNSANPMRRRQLEKHMEVVTCPACQGERLNPQARNVRLRTASARFAARAGKLTSEISDLKSAVTGSDLSSRNGLELSLPQVCRLSIDDAAMFFEALELDDVGQLIAAEALKEIRGRLGFLIQCGLGYLSLERSAPTLSGGESQRIRLAGQIGCGLVGVVYILDEPSIGLHPRDNRLLLSSLQRLRDQGNTVIVVEHDEETMRAADHLVDFGPGPGVRGGEVVVSGSVADLSRCERSLTGAFLSGREAIAVPGTRRCPDRGELIVHGATHHNLRDVTVRFPLGRLICVTGVSGSGKSSLVNDILWQVVNRDVNGGTGEPGKHGSITGLEHIDKGIVIDQSPIGRTPRSNPATYVKVFDEIRRLFAQLPQSKLRGYKEGRFSFNVTGGRCEACEGHGATRLEMDFLADLWVPCAVCEGRRFSHETLEVKFRDRSIADVLSLEIRDALELFDSFPKIRRLLQTLCDVGLDYMQLGQASPTLSGGEAQRVKLARELGKRSTGRTLYLLDEPTTGLHFVDVRKLIEVLQGFVDAGNTVVVVEHNLDLIKTADWVIDLGPEGGAGGGTVIAEGTPEDVANCEASHTGRALRTVLPVRAPGRLPGRVAESPAVYSVARKTRKRVSPAGMQALPMPDVPASPAVTDAFALSPAIRISGASQHNLQSIDVEIPREQMSVFCGPSGSGKTSLAMDTLYAEGQRRYVESLSAYARQFLGQMPKPRVDSIRGLSPAIAIEQKTVGATPRSTVGTVTEIHDYLRVLFARLGQVMCPECRIPAVQQTTDQIVESVLSHPAGTKLLLLAPLVIDRTVPFAKLWARLRASGVVRVRVDGVSHSLDDVPELDHRRAHEVAVVMDRITVDRRQRGRITDSVEACLDLGRGVLQVAIAEPGRPEPEWTVHRHSLHLSCPDCQRSFEHPSPQKFSFNSPLGWCPACEGLGTEFGANQALLVTSPERSLRDGAIGAWPDPRTNTEFRRLLEAMAAAFGLPLDQPWYLLSPQQQRLVLYGDHERWIEVAADTAAAPAQRASRRMADDRPVASDRPAQTPRPPVRFKYKGLYPTIEEVSRLSYSHRRSLLDMAGTRDCSLCSGSRLQPEAAAVALRGITLPQLSRMPLPAAYEFLTTLKLSRDEKRIAGDLLNEATHRLKFLIEVGLEYLTLDRAMPTLSGGESQRIRLAGQAGRSLTGVLYVLDEPTIGLHPRDNARLLAALRRLKDLGNTVLLVEHDREVLQAADRVFDFGPGAGRLGGCIVAQGTPAELQKSKTSLTGGYLGGRLQIPVPEVRRVIEDPETGRILRNSQRFPGACDLLELRGASQHNLQNVDLRIPLQALTCVTGVSGSGKSSLIMNTLAPAVARRLNMTSEAPGMFRELQGVEHLSKLVLVDQHPIGTTPASNPATYTGVFDEIRELFCRMPDARVRGFRPGRFSFNRAGGRCEDCEGMGQRKIEMHFLPDVWVECTTCRGRRFNAETLAVKFNGCTIADVLEMPVSRALELFANVPKIRGPLATLEAIGLGYLTLGQSAPTLSGGEAQRLKLAAELCRPNRGRTLYLLDEPTTGLHFDDIVKLLSVLNSLVEQGNSVVVIEHNLDFIKTADWIVDLGPEAGAGGGRVVVQGTPETVAAYARQTGLQAGGRRETRAAKSTALRSWTGELLAPVLEQSRRGTIATFNVREALAHRATDVSLEELGRSVKLPWEVDGRKWHSRDRIAHTGQPCRWEGTALEFVVDLLSGYDALAEPNWNDRATVEVKAKRGTGWLLHARTGGEWLLTLCFRVARRQFSTEALDRRLGLKPLDDLEEIPVYGREPRVKARDLKSAWQEVTIKVWKKAEIDTPAFRTFVDEAVRSYLKLARAEAANPEDLMPWKKLGRKWHLMPKGLPENSRGQWEFGVLERLLPIVEKALSGSEVHYGNRGKILWTGVEGQPVAELQTKRSDGVELVVYCPAGRVTIGSIAEHGASQKVEPARDGREAVGLLFRTVKQVRGTSLSALLERLLSLE